VDGAGPLSTPSPAVEPARAADDARIIFVKALRNERAAPEARRSAGLTTAGAWMILTPEIDGAAAIGSSPGEFVEAVDGHQGGLQ